MLHQSSQGPNRTCLSVQDQAKGLVTYLQRIYHNFISHGPIAPLGQRSSEQGMCHAIVVHHFPVVLDGQSGSSDYLSAAVAVSSMDLLPAAMEAVNKELVKQGDFFCGLE